MSISQRATPFPQREPDLETRLTAVARAIEALPDIRDAVTTSETELDAWLGQLEKLTCELAAREREAGWDVADLVAVRLALQTVAATTVHLRRRILTLNGTLAEAAAPLQRVDRAIGALIRRYAAPDSRSTSGLLGRT